MVLAVVDVSIWSLYAWILSIYWPLVVAIQSTFCIIYALDVPVAISTAISDIFLGVQPDKIWGMFFSSRVHSIDWSRYTDTSPFLLIIIWWSGVFFKCIIIIFLWLSFILPPTWSELYISSSVLILYVLVYRELIYLKRYRETVI